MLRKLVSRGLGALCAAAAAEIFAVAAHATPVVLTDGTSDNSSATIDPLAQSGQSTWVVSGVNHLAQQWFWYSVGTSAPQSISTLSNTHLFTDPVNGILNATYTGDGFTLNLGVTFQGSGIVEQINVTPSATLTGDVASAAGLNFHLYQYSDFNLNGTAAGDTLNLSGTPTINTADQTKGGTKANYGAVSNATTSEYQTGTGSTIKGLLNNGVNPVTLSDNSTGPVLGDDNFAFEWDQSIGPSGNLQVSITQSIQGGNIVPLPNAAYGTLALMALLGGVGLVRKVAKRIA